MGACLRLHSSAEPLPHEAFSWPSASSWLTGATTQTLPGARAGAAGYGHRHSPKSGCNILIPIQTGAVTRSPRSFWEGLLSLPQAVGAGQGGTRKFAERTLRNLLALWGKVPQAHSDWWAAARAGCCGQQAPWGDQAQEGGGGACPSRGSGKGADPKRHLQPWRQSGPWSWGSEQGGLSLGPGGVGSGLGRRAAQGMGPVPLSLQMEVQHPLPFLPTAGVEPAGSTAGPIPALNPDLNWMTSGTRALPTHLVQRASLPPSDGVGMTTVRSAELEASRPTSQSTSILPCPGRAACSDWSPRTGVHSWKSCTTEPWPGSGPVQGEAPL